MRISLATHTQTLTYGCARTITDIFILRLQNFLVGVLIGIFTIGVGLKHAAVRNFSVNQAKKLRYDKRLYTQKLRKSISTLITSTEMMLYRYTAAIRNFSVNQAMKFRNLVVQNKLKNNMMGEYDVNQNLQSRPEDAESKVASVRIATRLAVGCDGDCTTWCSTDL